LIIKSVHVRNFRSIADESLRCDDLTVLAGPNGAGKSAFLRSLEIFYTPSPRISVEDFYAEDTDEQITISVTFTDLSEQARAQFKGYIQGDELTVERVIAIGDGKPVAKYHGSTLQNLDLSRVREAEGAANKRAAYAAVQEQERYRDLPRWSNQTAALEALKDWEARHPEACVRRRDEGQFFGFTEVGQGYLGRYTRYVLVPAVRDASEDAAEGKGSILSEIMDLVVRSILAEKEEIKQLREQTQDKYEEILAPGRLPELRDLAEQLTSALQTYAPDTRVELRWQSESAVDIPLPKAETKLVEDGFPSTVGRTGHGLQRAFILTMLQQLAQAQTPVSEGQAEGVNGKDEAQEPKMGHSIRIPHLILGIEEPELYQHPSRQRRLAKILMELASGSIRGVAGRTQVIYSTHSPLLLGLESFDRLRLLRKERALANGPKETRVAETTLDEVAEEIWVAAGKPTPKYTAETIRPRLRAIMTPWMNEGFFADVVVLVEGESDRAWILGAALAKGRDLETEGYAVIPCFSKSSLDRPLVIFRRLRIPVYVIWDGDRDRGEKPEENRRLLQLLGERDVDWPETRVTGRYACFETRMEETLREELGPELFERVIIEWQDEFGISRRDQALKNPDAIRTLIEEAKDESKTSPTLEAIIEGIVALKWEGK